MSRADIPAVGRLFLQAFRHRKEESTPEFNDYFERLFFDCPNYNAAHGSIIHENRDGQIDAAIAVLPMKMVACGRPLMGRLMSAYMADPESKSGGAARLALTLRPRQQIFCFSDTATEQSANHIRAMGGIVLPLESREWRRLFRPVGHIVCYAERRWRGLANLKLATLAAPMDRMLNLFRRRRWKSLANGLHVVPMSDDDFITMAGGLIARFAVRPAWAPDELSWVLKMAREYTALGPLCVRSVLDVLGNVIGCFLYYGLPGQAAVVLNIMARDGLERDVLSAMTTYLEAADYTSMRGMGQPWLAEPLKALGGFRYRHRAYFWVTTRYPDVRDAVLHGDFYIGGLASESWSRLPSDF